MTNRNKIYLSQAARLERERWFVNSAEVIARCSDSEKHLKVFTYTSAQFVFNPLAGYIRLEDMGRPGRVYEYAVDNDHNAYESVLPKYAPDKDAAVQKRLSPLASEVVMSLVGLTTMPVGTQLSKPEALPSYEFEKVGEFEPILANTGTLILPTSLKSLE